MVVSGDLVGATLRGVGDLPTTRSPVTMSPLALILTEPRFSATDFPHRPLSKSHIYSICSHIRLSRSLDLPRSGTDLSDLVQGEEKHGQNQNSPDRRTVSSAKTARLHPGRAFGRHRHYRIADRDSPAGPGAGAQQANRTGCLANLRSLGQAMYLYANAHHDRLPNSNSANTWDSTIGGREASLRTGGELHLAADFPLPGGL